MEGTTIQRSLGPLEVGILSTGLPVVGVAIAVTTVSYATNMTFHPQWLVWAVATAFAAVALLALAWPRAFHSPRVVPEGRWRRLLLLSMPLAFLVSSQVCGLGTRACNLTCHAVNLSLIGLGALAAFRVHRGWSVVPVLIPMIVVGLIPHCVCHAPINVTWHGVFAGLAPTCEMLPLAAVLFSISALGGARPRGSSALVAAMFGVMFFIIVGGALFGFPWTGCMHHTAG